MEMRLISSDASKEIDKSQWKPATPKARRSTMDSSRETYRRTTNTSKTSQKYYNDSYSSEKSSILSEDISAEYSFSEESGEEDKNGDSSYSEYGSTLSPRVYERHPTISPSPNLSYNSRRPAEPIMKARRINTLQHHQKCTMNSHVMLISFGIIILCVLTAGGFYINHTDIKEVKPHDFTLESAIQKIKSKFSNQKRELWESVFAGIYDAVLYPGKPGIIILYGDKSDTVNCLAHSLGRVSGVALGTDDYLALKPEDFKPDIGEVIYELRDKISQARAVVVQDLLSINSEALKAFHNFCDRENPLVGQAVYIITMITHDSNRTKSDLYIVERAIAKKFEQKIDKDILAPLITRITDGAVVRVSSETVNDCR